MNVLNKAKSAARRLRGIGEYYFQQRPYMLQQIKMLQLKKTSQTAFLIATGPSVKRQNLALLSGQDCFTISNAYLHGDIADINPLVHGFAEYHQPMDRGNYIQWLQHASATLPHNTSIYTTTSNKGIVAESGIGAHRDVIFGQYDMVARYLWPKCGEYLYLPPQSGPLLMLPMLISMGYKRICLVGCDHTTLRNYGGSIANFYDVASDMRKHATDPSVWTNIISHLEADIVLFKQYEMYARWCAYLGVKIVNLSDDSWLRAFSFSTIEAEVGHR
ncbi:MAG: hypothetical protein Q7K13_04885 [Polynucleobacter sp.]|nr:hypothetical protein [Polynucleobacter sp.]